MTPLLDPSALVDARLSRTLETSRYLRRPPASLEEANAWAQELGSGLVLEERDGTIEASLPEFPGWHQPLTAEQLERVVIATQHGRELGQRMSNLNIPLRQAARVYKRGSDYGFGP